MHFRISLLAFSAALMVSAPMQAAFPEKPITAIVAYSPGGGSDVMVRMLAPFIEKYLGAGAKIEVVNKPGAGGELGFAELANAPPDGYTIGLINSPNVVTIPIERQARYTLDKLDPLINVVDDPSVWVVHMNGPYKTVADLISYAQANPNTVTVGTTGVGSDDHLSMLRVQRLTKAKFTHVPFPGASANEKAVIAQKTAVAIGNLSEGMANRKANPVRILGVLSGQRWDIAGDVPTFKEQGIDVVMASIRGIAAPKGLPADIRATLVDALTKAVNDPEFVAKANDPVTFQPLRILNSEEFSKELMEAEADFRAMWKDDPWLK